MSWKITRYSESYAINSYAQTPCVLISGWSVNSDIFEWLLPGLAQYFIVYSADVKDLPENVDDCVAELAETLQKEVCKPALVIGWSLGGNLALALAEQYPQQVSGLCLIAGNPSFVARDDWPCAMPAAQLKAFQQGIAGQRDKTLRRFDLLQIKGDEEQANLRKALGDYRKQQTPWSDADLARGLVWLGQFDQRELVQSLRVPMLWCFGREDQLVPVALAGYLDNSSDRISTAVFDDCAHLPFLTCPDSFFSALLEHFDPDATSREKRKIAEAFSAAANRYDEAAGIQQWTAERLLNKTAFKAGQRVLDAGCGTGQWTEALAGKTSVIGLDLAEGMVQFARDHRTGVNHWLTGDAEQLPLADQSLDGIFSSLAVQWVQHPKALLLEWCRALKSDGRIFVATLGPKTLYELRESFAAIDRYQHVNRFLTADDWRYYAGVCDLTVQSCEVIEKPVYYPDVKSLLQALKAIGAHTVVQHGMKGMMGKTRWQQLQQNYQVYRDDNGLPATYELILLELTPRHG